MITNELKQFLNEFLVSLNDQKVIKLTLSKPTKLSHDLVNVYSKPILIKNAVVVSCTHRYKTRDEVKNLFLDQLEDFLVSYLPNNFKEATLITTDYELKLTYNKKFKPSLKRLVITKPKLVLSGHDLSKTKLISLSEPFLNFLGITTKNGQLIPKMADKYRQINKYIEILSSNLKQLNTNKLIKVVDMGSGKGYLTFALYKYLKDQGVKCTITGVELRQDLVDKCNGIAQECGFDGLTFLPKRIEDFKAEEIDVLIALHACDTATDDAIAAGITSNTQLIVCAPCCHKQVRKSIDFNLSSNPILSHGIFIERSCEMLTDTIRAMILESNGYRSKVFEFISNEHTRKNIMLTAFFTGHKKELNQQIIDLKNQYGLEEHYLEKLLKEKK